MKIIVLSDSHEHSNNVKEVLDMHKSNTDAVIFLGDGIKDIAYIRNQYPNIAFYIVKGNCDLFAPSTEKEKLINLDGFRILITHGDMFNVKYGYRTIAQYAYEIGADAVFFGHTHYPYDDYIEIQGKKIHLFNPGSVGVSGSFGVVNTSGKVLVTSHGKLF